MLFELPKYPAKIQLSKVFALIVDILVMCAGISHKISYFLTQKHNNEVYIYFYHVEDVQSLTNY